MRKLLGVVEHRFVSELDEQPGLSITSIMHLIFGAILLGWVAIEALIVTTVRFV